MWLGSLWDNSADLESWDLGIRSDQWGMGHWRTNTAAGSKSKLSPKNVSGEIGYTNTYFMIAGNRRYLEI